MDPQQTHITWSLPTLVCRHRGHGKHSFLYCCVLDHVYRAVTWQRVGQIRYNMNRSDNQANEVWTAKIITNSLGQFVRWVNTWRLIFCYNTDIITSWIFYETFNTSAMPQFKLMISRQISDWFIFIAMMSTPSSAAIKVILRDCCFKSRS
jgi:hypothetical protein